ncbi:MAG TPA: hypothetical protein VGF13_11000, partial [Verrucomicrobiae bacterium]
MRRRILLLLLLAWSILTSDSLAITNDLRLTSITRTTNGCTTLTWISHPGEFYTVYWTTNLCQPIFWRVAEVNVPSSGTSKIWSEGDCGSSMMSNEFSSSSSSSGGLTNLFSEKELQEMMAAAQARAEESIKLLTQQLEALPTNSQNGFSLLSSPDPGGTNTSTNVYVFPMTAKFYRVARTAVTGFVDGWSSGYQTNSPGITNAIAVSANPRYAGVFSSVLRADGTVTNWGANSFGQCNVPTNLTDVVAIAAGGRHSIAVKRDKTVVSWGENGLGQVTNAPANLTNVVDVKAGLWHTLALRDDGTVAVWGDLFNRSNNVPAAATNITAISAGPRHCLALRCDGKVIAWGFSYTNIL